MGWRAAILRRPLPGPPRGEVHAVVRRPSGRRPRDHRRGRGHRDNGDHALGERQLSGGMSMPFLNPGHFWLILLLLVAVLIIWGPGKLPDLGAGMAVPSRTSSMRPPSTATRQLTSARP